MKNKYLFNHIFILGLFLLILNNHFLKAAYGNGLTGKLSDVVGILILPMFLKYLFSISTKKSVLLTAVFFIFWKTSLSQVFLDAFNSLELFQIGRVIDYTDFFALLILPFAGYVINNIEKFEITLNRFYAKKLVTRALFGLTMVAFVATSMDDFEPENLLAECCYNEPVELNVGSGSIYVPTMFTPDGNGINDFFQISADSNILKIDSLLVFSPFDGDPVFEVQDVTEIIPQNGFDGTVADTVAATQYYYLLVVTSKDNVTMRIDGVVCALPCVEPLEVPRPDSLSNCAFPIQYDIINGYDENINSEEDLNCF